MTYEVSIEHKGEVFTASYQVFDDVLVVYLPDGSTRKTFLNGLKANSAAETHLRFYANTKTRNNGIVSE